MKWSLEREQWFEKTYNNTTEADVSVIREGYGKPIFSERTKPGVVISLPEGTYDIQVADPETAVQDVIIVQVSPKAKIAGAGAKPPP